jgi:hypothetical protein
VNLAYGAIVSAGILAVAVYYGVKMELFKECLTTFGDTKVSMYQPVFMFIDRVGFSLLAVFIGQYSFGSYILLGWVTTYTVLLAISNPYKRKRDYYRSLATQAATILILCLYCCLANSPADIPASIFTVAPLIVLAVLMVNLANNCTFVIIQIR